MSKKDASRGGTVKIDNLSDDFHTYVMEWDKDSIKLMVDDKLVKSIDLNTTNYANQAGNPFRTPFYLILNSAVGGNWCEKAPKDGQGYPVKFLIDYVRFYQTKEHAQQAKQFDPGNRIAEEEVIPPFSWLERFRYGGRSGTCPVLSLCVGDKAETAF